MVINIKQSLAYLLLAAAAFSGSSIASQHQHISSAQNDVCKQNNSIQCAKTATTAFSPDGRLWRVWSSNQQMFYQVSHDQGSTFEQAVKVDIPAENIAARNENRPKIAFDKNQGVYLSWAKKGKKRFTGDIRFSYSTDDGKTFSIPQTINNDGYITGHSFNEMIVSPDGEVTIVWLDSRYRYEQQKLGNKINGSELYLAKGNPRKQQSFTNEPLASGTCVCCRIAMDNDINGNLAVFWRHIFGDNIREFALITLDEKQPELAKTKQISFDHWYIEGCPHQGGAVSINEDNRYQLVWYNQGDNGKGIFTAYSDNAGQTLSKPTHIGNNSQQAAHPHLQVRGNLVDIVWTEFDGEHYQLWHQHSNNGGISYSKATLLKQSTTSGDRPFLVKQGNALMVSWQLQGAEHWIKPL